MRSRVVRRSARGGLAVLATAAVLLLGACGPSRIGAAAIVGDQRVPISRVDQVVRYQQAQQNPGQQQASDLTTQVVQQMVYDLLVIKLAQREGVATTQGSLDKTFQDAEQKAVDQQLAQAKQARDAGQSGVPTDKALTQQVQAQFEKVKSAPDYDEQVRAVYAQDTLIKRYGDSADNPEQLNKNLRTLATSIGVQVNPRYGSFDVRSLRVTADGGGLFTPAPDSSSGGGGGIQSP